jgi:hypothetical protein
MGGLEPGIWGWLEVELSQDSPWEVLAGLLSGLKREMSRKSSVSEDFLADLLRFSC